METKEEKEIYDFSIRGRKKRQRDEPLRIVCLSDTHNQISEIKIPDGDVLIHAGDFTNYGTDSEFTEFNDFIGRLPHKVKICVQGNHDFLFKKDEQQARTLLSNCTVLVDEHVMVEGFKVFGTSWDQCYHDRMKAKTGKLLKEKWKLIPDDVDVLVTHTPPKGYGASPRGREDVGCIELLEVIRRTQPLLHIAGHIHHGYGVIKEQGTVFVNAANCNENGKIKNEPIVLLL